MFAQKKKKSKIWIAVPVILALGVGLWLNAGLKDDTGEESIPAGSDQYEETQSYKIFDFNLHTIFYQCKL